mmetsp:Transcript_357/g.648  ORF Transcript_357/g.648 Transcript_357/m.648 type:complete len:363 (+) Transcript_357:92-1180(+)
MISEATVGDLKYIWVGGVVLVFSLGCQIGLWVGNIIQFRKYKIHIQKFIAGLTVLQLLNSILQQLFLYDCYFETSHKLPLSFCNSLNVSDSILRRSLYYIVYYEDVVYFTCIAAVITLIVWGYGIMHSKLTKGKWLLIGGQLLMFTLVCLTLKILRLKYIPLLYVLCIYSCGLVITMIPNQRLLAIGIRQYYEANPDRNLNRIPFTQKLKLFKKLPMIFILYLILAVVVNVFFVLIKDKVEISNMVLMPIFVVLEGGIPLILLFRLYLIMRLKDYSKYDIYNSREHHYGLYLSDLEVDRLIGIEHSDEELDTHQQEDILTEEPSPFFKWSKIAEEDEEESDEPFVIVNHRRHHFSIVTSEAY